MKSRPCALTVDNPAGGGGRRGPLPLRATDTGPDPLQPQQVADPRHGLRVSVPNPAGEPDTGADASLAVLKQRAQARARSMVQLEEHKRLESVRMVQSGFDAIKVRARARAKALVALEGGDTEAPEGTETLEQFGAQLARFRQTAAARQRSAKVMLSHAGAGEKANPSRHHRRLSVPSTPTTPAIAAHPHSPHSTEDLAAISAVAGWDILAPEPDPDPDPDSKLPAAPSADGLMDSHSAALLAFRRSTQEIERRHLAKGARAFSVQVLDSVVKEARHRRMSCPTVLPSDHQELLQRLRADQHATTAGEQLRPVATVAELFDVIDTDGSGSISFTELTAWWGRLQESQQAGHDADGVLNRLKSLVAELDDSGDGELGRPELAMLLQELILDDPAWVAEHGESDPSEPQICAWLAQHNLLPSSTLPPPAHAPPQAMVAPPPSEAPTITCTFTEEGSLGGEGLAARRRSHARTRAWRDGGSAMARGPPVADPAAAAAAAAHYEDVLVASSALSLHFHQQQLLHVGGVGVHGWDGTESGVGEYESAEALQRIFSSYGGFSRATVRHKVSRGENRSWALITMEDKQSADKVVQAAAESPIMAGSTPLFVAPFSSYKAQASTGAMQGVLSRERDPSPRNDGGDAQGPGQTTVAAAEEPAPPPKEIAAKPTKQAVEARAPTEKKVATAKAAEMAAMWAAKAARAENAKLHKQLTALKATLSSTQAELATLKKTAAAQPSSASAAAAASSAAAARKGVAIAGPELHVSGIGVTGWDGTMDGLGTYESAQALESVLSAYGKVSRTVVRHKIKDGENKSWALVTMADTQAAAAVLEAAPIITAAGSTPLTVMPFNKFQAQASTGAVNAIHSVGELKGALRNAKLQAEEVARRARVAETELREQIEELRQELTSRQALVDHHRAQQEAIEAEKALLTAQLSSAQQDGLESLQQTVEMEARLADARVEIVKLKASLAHAKDLRRQQRHELYKQQSVMEAELQASHDREDAMHEASGRHSPVEAAPTEQQNEQERAMPEQSTDGSAVPQRPRSAPSECGSPQSHSVAPKPRPQTAQARRRRYKQQPLQHQHQRAADSSRIGGSGSRRRHKPAMQRTLHSLSSASIGIVVDGGGGDSSASLSYKYVKEDPRYYYQQPRKGPGGGRDPTFARLLNRFLPADGPNSRSLQQYY